MFCIYIEVCSPAGLTESEEMERPEFKLMRLAGSRGNKMYWHDDEILSGTLKTANRWESFLQ